MQWVSNYIFSCRKVVIHDTTPFLFRIFLEYLYSGRLKQQLLSTEQLAEILLLSDRYEVDTLKQACECALQSSIDMESVLYFLSMADQFNARYLRVILLICSLYLFTSFSTSIITSSLIWILWF